MSLEISPEFDKNNSVVITETQVDDIEAVSHLLALSWLETYVNDEQGVTEEWVRQRVEERQSPERISAQKERLLTNKENPDFGSFVAKDDLGKVIGITTPYRDNDDKQHLGALYVDKYYHGKGVASKLMEKVLEWSDPHSPIYLGVAVYNERAKAFYRKWGFHEIQGSERLFADMIPEIEMIREGETE